MTSLTQLALYSPAISHTHRKHVNSVISGRSVLVNVKQKWYVNSRSVC